MQRVHVNAMHNRGILAPKLSTHFGGMAWSLFSIGYVVKGVVQFKLDTIQASMFSIT